ncbi:MAG: PTS sugar transporter subunit IIA [Christensenellales bacterium]|jgi:PTS system glucose-specific IIA component
MMESAEKKRSFDIFSPVTGLCAPLMPESPPDRLQSAVAIEPASGSVVAPVTGSLIYTSPTNNAFAIRTDDGFTVRVTVGESGVEPDGRGYTKVVQPGDRVTVGKKVLVADLDMLRMRNRPVLTTVYLEDRENVERVELYEGNVIAGISPIMSVVYNYLNPAERIRESQKRKPVARGNGAPM